MLDAFDLSFAFPISNNCEVIVTIIVEYGNFGGILFNPLTSPVLEKSYAIEVGLTSLKTKTLNHVKKEKIRFLENGINNRTLGL